jgi:hypothetical protein
MDKVQLGTDIGPGPDHWQSSRQAVSWKDSQADKQSVGKTDMWTDSLPNRLAVGEVACLQPARRLGMPAI